MKRYWVFGYLDYYPEGGMNDFIKDFDTINEAVRLVEASTTKKPIKEGSSYTYTKWDKASVFDTETRKLVYDSVHGEIDWDMGE